MPTLTDSPSHERPSVVSALSEPLAAVAFWSAVGLPLLYVPLLANGLSGGRDLTLFLGLFGLHLVALVAGRSYASR